MSSYRITLAAGLALTLPLTALATPPAPSPQVGLLADAGLDVAAGRGEVNGVDFEIGVLRAAQGGAAALLSDLRAGLAGRVTLTENDTPLGPLLIAWNLKTAACPTCAAVQKGEVDALFETAIALTVFELPNGGALAIASPAGALLRAAGGRGAYRGTLSPDVAHGWCILQQATYQFDDGRVASHVATTDDNVKIVAAKLRSQLTGGGYAPLQSTGSFDGTESVAGPVEATYASRAAAVHYRLVPQRGGGTRIEINESSAPRR